MKIALWNWVLVALCVAWLLAMLWISVPAHDLLNALWSQTMAAWIQAVGSVAAIVAAIWVAERSRRESTLRGWVATTNGALVAATYLRSILERSRGHCHASEWSDGLMFLIRREVEGALALLNRTDPGLMTNAEAAGALVNLTKLTHAAAAHLMVVENCGAKRETVPVDLFDELTDDVIRATDQLSAAAQPVIDRARRAVRWV